MPAAASAAIIGLNEEDWLPKVEVIKWPPSEPTQTAQGPKNPPTKRKGTGTATNARKKLKKDAGAKSRPPRTETDESAGALGIRSDEAAAVPEPPALAETTICDDKGAWTSWSTLPQFASKLPEVDEAQLLAYGRQCHLPQSLISNILRLGWKAPTEVQARTIPVACIRRADILMASETGSGKTGAFAIPIIDLLLRGKDVNVNALRALIMAASRELSQQIGAVFDSLCRDTGLEVVTISGGLSKAKQERLLAKRPPIVVGTMGRLMQYVIGDKEEEPHEFLTELGFLQVLVLDEADRLMEKDKIARIKRFTSHLLAKKKSSSQRVDGEDSSAGVEGSAESEISVEAPAKERKRIGKVQIFVVSASLALGENALELLPLNLKNTVKIVISADAVDIKKKQADYSVDTGLSIADLKLAKGHSSKKAPAVALPTSLRLSFCFLNQKNAKKGPFGENQDKETYLYVLLSKIFTEDHDKAKSLKVLVFCNAISFVLRLNGLLSLLFWKDRTKGALSILNRKAHESKRQDRGARIQNQVPLTRGVALLQRCLGQGDKASTLESGKSDTAGITSEDDSPANGSMAGSDESTVDDSDVDEHAKVQPGQNGKHSRELSRERADGLEIPIFALHAKLPQKKRLEALEHFQKRENSGVLLASDVAARGIDLPEVDYVIIVQRPGDAKILQHRVGRCARAGKEGQAILLASPSEVPKYEELISQLGLDFHKLPEWGLWQNRAEISHARAIMQHAAYINATERKIQTLEGQKTSTERLVCEAELGDTDAEVFEPEESLHRELVRLRGELRGLLKSRKF